MDEKTCPQCTEKVEKDAIVCKNCRYYFVDAAKLARHMEDRNWILNRLFGGIALLVVLIVIGVLLHRNSKSGETESTPPDAITSPAAPAAPTPKIESSPDPKTTEPAPSPTERQLSPQMQAYGEMIATAINLNGLLCAKVVDVRPLKVNDDTFEVTCIEYRGGSGKVIYIVNAETGEAFQQ